MRQSRTDTLIIMEAPVRNTDMNRPFPLYLAPSQRSATVEALFTVEPAQTLAPGDLEELLEEVQDRIDRALEGIFEGLPALVQVDDVSIVNPEHVPFFPAVFGNDVHRDQVEVFEAIEGLRRDTALQGLLYDCAGRAFRVHVWTSFQREKGEDLPVPEAWAREMSERGRRAGWLDHSPA